MTQSGTTQSGSSKASEKSNWITTSQTEPSRCPFMKRGHLYDSKVVPKVAFMDQKEYLLYGSKVVPPFMNQK
jgi:hypothetical protein